MATRSTTGTKSTPKSSAGTAKAKQSGPDLSVVSETTPVVSGPELKKRELIDMVCERTDVKKKFAKPVVEAVIEILGEALADGREMNLQPMGKLMYQRSKETANARITVAKIRQSLGASAGSAETAKEGVADEAE